MTKNIHPLEREVRIVLGAISLFLVFLGPKSPWFLLGLIPLITGIIGWCPPYALLGINTCKTKSAKKDN